MYIVLSVISRQHNSVPVWCRQWHSDSGEDDGLPTQWQLLAPGACRAQSQAGDAAYRPARNDHAWWADWSTFPHSQPGQSTCYWYSFFTYHFISVWCIIIFHSALWYMLRGCQTIDRVSRLYLQAKSPDKNLSCIMRNCSILSFDKIGRFYCARENTFYSGRENQQIICILFMSQWWLFTTEDEYLFLLFIVFVFLKPTVFNSWRLKY